jgi:uncharacterized membrane protein YecN with MAPEG domain
VTVVPVYAALLALGYLLLALRVIALRRRYRVAVGDGRKGELRRAIRVHGNFAEYVPLALLLLAFMEWRGAVAPLLHLLGVALLVGRLLHALGVCRENEDLRFRTAGTALTCLTLFSGAAYLLLTSW